MIRAEIVSAFQDDACQQISIMVAEEVENGAVVTPQLLNETASRLIESSVIRGQIREDGAAVDVHGRPFEIVVEDQSVVTSTQRTIVHPFRSSASWKINE
ncbi:MAG: hypothetical protein AAF585_27950, partial [Verrucomicrobiota bacterium]